MRFSLLLRMSTKMEENLLSINNRIKSAYDNATMEQRFPKPPRLVAVSKTKPKEMILEAYELGHRHFGENYIQELVEKSNDPELKEKCPEIRWHFIGNCQSNKAKDLMSCPCLTVIETVTSIKLATKLNSSLAASSHKASPVLAFVQVNTSGEANKNGLPPGEEVVKAVSHILKNCPNMKFSGLMTIGDLGSSKKASTDQALNPDFHKLLDQRKLVSDALGLEETEIELSMGMSQDFEVAITMGSSNVRVGSSIFGARNYPAAPTVTNSVSTGEETSGGFRGGESVISVETVSSRLDKVTL